MTITIKTPEWTVIVRDADTKDWEYRVVRGNPTTDDVHQALRKINKSR